MDQQKPDGTNQSMNENGTAQKKKKNTVILLVILAVVICAGFLIRKLFFGKSGATVVVQQHGEVIAELDLSKDTELELDDGSGGTNTLVVSGGAVSMTEANCPDLVCVHTGEISHTGEVIACLPHELIITISGDAETTGVDSTAW